MTIFIKILSLNALFVMAFVAAAILADNDGT